VAPLSEIFALEMPLEIFIRGTAVYWFIFIVFRLVMRRDAGSIGMADVLLLVLLADASQNAMAGEYTGVFDGFLLICTLVFWNVLVDWLCYRYPRVERLLNAPKLCLVRDGQMLKRNMRRELISEEELHSKLRLEGIDDVAQVRRAYMESDGSISVLKRE
jgi:uncharacterized membrane protein YcaP (DUF421 family)